MKDCVELLKLPQFDEQPILGHARKPRTRAYLRACAIGDWKSIVVISITDGAYGQFHVLRRTGLSRLVRSALPTMIQ